MKKNNTIHYHCSIRHVLYAIILCGVFSFTACDFIHFNTESKPREPYAARTYDNYLYLSELQKQFPGNMSAEDSLFWITNYIDFWIKDQLFLHQAIKNLSEKEQDFTPQLEAYKNSLLRYAYEIRLIDKNLDTLISNSEIQQYYQEHSNDYILSRNAAKVCYIGVWVDSLRAIQAIKKLFTASSLNLDAIEYYCENIAIPIVFTDTTQWLYFDDIMDIIPVPNENVNACLTRNYCQEFSDSRFWYFLLVTNRRFQNEHTPLELMSDWIKKTILVRRKETLLKEQKKKIYEDAKKNKTFEIF